MPTSELQKSLFDAVEDGDLDRLTDLCSEHEQAIVDSFSSWRTVPEGFRDGPKLGWYIQGMSAVAQHMAAMRGHPELLDELMQAPDDTKKRMEQLDAALIEVDKHVAEGRYREALAVAEVAVSEAGQEKSGQLAMLLGRSGVCLFQLGDPAAARVYFEKALALCEEGRDLDGIMAALSSLYEVFRFLGDGEKAGDIGDRLAELQEQRGQTEEAARTRRHAAIVRAGEPLCRVVMLVNGDPVELDDARPLEGTAQFIYVRNRIELDPCVRATTLGEQAGSRGDFTQALEWFQRAAAADPHDPAPIYQAGVTLLYMNRPAEAVALFKKTEELAPGWYRTRAYLHLAKGMASGVLPADVFATLDRLDGQDMPLDEKLRLAQDGINRTNLGLFYVALGDALSGLGRKMDARVAYRRGLDVAEEPDVRTQLLVKLGNLVDNLGERRVFYHEAVRLAGNLLFAAIAKISLASIPASALN